MKLEVKCCSSPRGAKWAGFDQPPCYPQLEQVRMVKARPQVPVKDSAS